MGTIVLLKSLSIKLLPVGLVTIRDVVIVLGNFLLMKNLKPFVVRRLYVAGK
jgi:hypothetical protein|tara:strand:- start:12065 stop:12220 length:156 start_codon:yes stop_codon:yes gene_type:complete